MITMICSVCGIGHTEEEFLIGKSKGCKACDNDWFYTNNEHNKNKVRTRLIENNLPIPNNLKLCVQEPHIQPTPPERPTLIRRKQIRSLF